MASNLAPRAVKVETLENKSRLLGDPTPESNIQIPILGQIKSNYEDEDAAGDGRDDDGRPNSGCTGNDCGTKTSDCVPRKAMESTIVVD